MSVNYYTFFIDEFDDDYRSWVAVHEKQFRSWKEAKDWVEYNSKRPETYLIDTARVWVKGEYKLAKSELEFNNLIKEK